jgi:anti-anti-sigma regulatory factor
MKLIEGLLGDVPTLTPIGTVDRGSSGVLEAALDKLTKARYNIVFLDLTDVDGIAGDGVRVLTAWVRALGGKGWLGVVAPKPEVRGILEAGGLLPHPSVRVFETRQLARVATQERQST